jgi:cysteine desulfurase
MIYFDHNATTQPDERVLDAMLPYLQHLYGNPSSLYRLGRIARSAIDTAREQVACLVDAPASQVLFTSGGTEANAFAMSSFQGRRLWRSAMEHPAITENISNCDRKYQAVKALVVEASGVVSSPEATEALQHGDCVSLMLANNETGAIQPLSSWVESVKAAGGLIHTDAVQAVGKMPVSFRDLHVDLMSLSSHKIYGPKGCGALIWGADVVLKPLQRGGDQEFGLRGGTENVAAIVGFGKAAELAKLELEQRISHVLSLRVLLEQQLKSIPGLVVFAEQVPRLANTVQFGIPEMNGEMLLMQLDQKNIAVSSGSACATGSEQISPVLEAMGVEAVLAKSAIRVSLGKSNTALEVDQFVSVLKTLLAKH